MSSTQIFGFQIEDGAIEDNHIASNAAIEQTKITSSGSPDLNNTNQTLADDINQLATEVTALHGGAGGSDVPLSGGTMTGPLILNANPSTSLGAATKQYVDTSVAEDLPLSGGTMTGPL